MFIRDELYDISFCSVVTNYLFKINNADIDLNGFYKTTLLHTLVQIFLATKNFILLHYLTKCLLEIWKWEILEYHQVLLRFACAKI